MNKTIKALELLGEGVSIDSLSETIDSETLAAIESGDENVLINQLNARKDIVCMIVPAKDDEDEKQPEEEPNEEQEKQSIAS